MDKIIIDQSIEKNINPPSSNDTIQQMFQILKTFHKEESSDKIKRKEKAIQRMEKLEHMRLQRLVYKDSSSNNKVVPL